MFGVYKDCEIMLDSMGIPEKVVDDSIRCPRKSGCDLGEDPGECFASYLEGWRAEPESLATDNLEPSMLEIKRMAATLAGKPLPQSSTAGLEAARQLVQRAMSFEAGGAPKERNYTMTSGSETVQHQPYVDNIHEEAPEYDGTPDDDDDGPDQWGAEMGDSVGQAPLLFGALSTTGQLTQEALQWLVTGQSNVGKGWMGASHWRYRGGSSGTAEEVPDPSGGAQKRPRESRYLKLSLPGLVP